MRIISLFQGLLVKAGHLFYSFLLFTCTLFCCIFCSCVLSADTAAEESLCISLPQWPPEDSLSAYYPELSRWLICITDAENQKYFFTREAQISITVKKNRPLCLCAQPITLLYNGSECTYFKPAGFIYPASYNQTSETDNCASWEEGYLADIMKTLFREGLEEGLSPLETEYIVSTFNWKKAQEAIEKKICAETKLFYNPWLLPKKNVIEGISSRSFKASFFNTTGSTALESSSLPQKVLLSAFIPENRLLPQKKQFTVIKNIPLLIADGKKYGIYVLYKSSKNISLEFIYLPIYIEDI